MARNARGEDSRQPVPRQALLMQALSGLIRAAAKHLDQQVLHEMVRNVGAQLGRQALCEYCLTRHTGGRLSGYTWAECLKEIGEQFGWTLQVAVESEGVIRVTVLGCEMAEPQEGGSYLCKLGSGLFGGAMAEAIGDVKVCVSRCREASPLDCAFTIYYRTSEESLAASGIVYPRMGDRPAQRARGSPELGPGARRLTSREAQVLQLIAQGLPDKEIATALQLSVRTVENHAARVRKKLRISNRAALVRFALQNHLVNS